MRKLKIILSSILLLIAGVCVASGGVSAESNKIVRATINDDASISLGTCYNISSQSSIAKYGLGTYNLYEANNSGNTKALYTSKLTNLSGVDTEAFITPVLSTTYGSSIIINISSATGTSKRLPWLSHSFTLPNNLVQASNNGYLDVSASAIVQINNEDHASYSVLRSVLYNGTLSSVDSIESSTYKMSTISKTTTATPQTVTLSGAKSSDYLLVFAMNRIYYDGLFGDTPSRTMNMTVQNPTLTISSKDTTAPKVTFAIDNENWSNGEKPKTLTITIEDNESGIMSVSSDNTLNLISETADKEKVYTMDIPQNGTYSVAVTDNVGNVYTYSYEESKIDKSIPNSLNITMPNVIYSNKLKLNATFESDNYSPETIYYTLDGTTPTTSSKTLAVGDNELTLTSGITTFKAVVIDEVGNIGEVYSNTIKIRRTLNISSSQCSFAVTKPTTLDDDEGLQCFDEETIRLDFTPENNCSKKVIRINNNEIVLENDYYEFVVNGDMNVEIIYVYNLELISCGPSYIYNPDIDVLTPEFTLNTDKVLNLNISITKDGVEATPKNAGTYELNWSYSDYEFEGSGKFTFEIHKLDIYISVIEGQSKIYGDEDCDEFDYTISGVPNSHHTQLTLSREVGENVGSYAIGLTSHNFDDNYNINFTSQNYLIRARKLIVLADGLTKTYGDKDPLLTYQFYESSLVGDDKLIGNLTREAGENVGQYDILVGSLAGDNYDIIFLGATLSILPKDLYIEIDDVVTTYGEEKPLTFKTSIDVQSNDVTGSLSRTGGDDVGVYSIGLGTLANSNYNIKVSKYGSYTINRKQIDVTANASDKKYGDIDNLTYSATGMFEGDDLVGNLSRSAGEDVGKYEINVGTLYHKNYSINFISNYLTISPADLVVTIHNCEQVYGEIEEEFSYSITGLKYDDEITLELYRESGEDVGDYLINCKNIINPNYQIISITKGVYSITKATLISHISNTTFIYSGEAIEIEDNSFPFELTYIYKENGVECESMLNAGSYQVQAVFAGNNNYKESKSAITNVIVEKQHVYLTLAENKFIYDGNVKFPEFSYNLSCGLDKNKLSFVFENDIRPIEVGEYSFTIVSSDNNYDATTVGKLTIANSLSISNKNKSVIECAEATFDENAQNLILVEKSLDGKYNDQQIISTCSFENVTMDDDYVYTVKIKATYDAENVYVYQLGKDNSVREIVVTNEGGYYIFKVDNLTDTYLITKDVEPLPFWFWLVIVGGVVVALITTLQIIKVVKGKKLAKVNNASLDTYNIN